MLVLLFGDANFRNMIFGRQTQLISSTKKNTVPYSLANILTLPSNTEQSMLNALGAVPSSGSTQLA